MVNRTMQAKTVKLIKQSRARPRVLWASKYQKVRQSVDRSKIPAEYQGLFEYRNRAKGLIDPYLEVLFPGSTMSEERRKDYLAAVTSEKPYVQMSITLVDTRLRKLWRFADCRLTCIQFVEYQSIPKLWRQSCTYSNDDRAMECYANGTIRWVEVIQLGVEDTSAC